MGIHNSDTMGGVPPRRDTSHRCGSLYTIHTSGTAMDDKFLTFLIAILNTKLDERCKRAAAFGKVQRLRLIYQNKGTFRVVDSELMPPN